MSNQVKLVKIDHKTCFKSLSSSNEDDLIVKPLSTISSLGLLNRFSVKDSGALQEKTIKIRMDEAVKLLKASSPSKTVLNDIFYGKKAHV
ncbi:hypothetical protein ERO13_D02G120150v2 [Gossypium hirsutum]|uniref:Uncharacterized protein n=2 Tax=Gossypium TaxID=3633 RepID=A0A5D2VVV3_GOSMU|nr:hypothetical protein ERO13_D02G120150v2 [Gossypium hirsutum]TYH83764.1 hypothetical protein ES332_D02G153500v1 [Gossypium tomentosum]TYI93571.1 hypothetical protein E1A91_D02G144600v1 [Gossypium mustelinum]